tara:strand:+ start:8410 stop:8880 length:471 start_codon:yes stop_codon:yes gene_type:complete
VEIDENDPKLWRWYDLAKDLNIEKHWLEALDKTSGTNFMGAPASSSFYVYHDVVLPDRFVETVYREKPVTYCVGANRQELRHSGDGRGEMMVAFADVALDKTRADEDNPHPYHVKCGLSGGWPLLLFGTTFEPDVLDKQMDEVCGIDEEEPYAKSK